MSAIVSAAWSHAVGCATTFAALGRILNDGGTVVLDHVDFFDPTLEVACRALGWWSDELTSANAYLAVGDTDGFRLHWDDHEVIAVQLSGEKSWEVRGPSRPAPMYRDAERNRTPSEEVLWKGTMWAGDVMHIPRGDAGAGVRGLGRCCADGAVRGVGCIELGSAPACGPGRTPP